MSDEMLKWKCQTWIGPFSGNEDEQTGSGNLQSMTPHTGNTKNPLFLA